MATVRRFYGVTYSEEYSFGVGHAPEGYSFEILAEGIYYPEWVATPFVLNGGPFADYQANNLGWPLCSKKLKTVIEGHASPIDSFQWLEARVIAVNEEDVRDYYILHFPERPDVLDKQRTLFAGDSDFVVRPYFSEQAIGTRRVFSYPGRSTIIVSSEVRDAVLAANCTGIDFYKVAVSN